MPGVNPLVNSIVKLRIVGKRKRYVSRLMKGFNLPF